MIYLSVTKVHLMGTDTAHLKTTPLMHMYIHAQYDKEIIIIRGNDLNCRSHKGAIIKIIGGWLCSQQISKEIKGRRKGIQRTDAKGTLMNALVVHSSILNLS